MERRRVVFFLLAGVAVAVLVGVFWARRAGPPGSVSRHIRGPLNALVVVTLYADANEESSRDALRELRRLAETFPLDLRVEYRHLTRARWGMVAPDAAISLECAGRVGKFWTAGSGSGVSAVNPDSPEWRTCLQDRAIRSTVSADIAEAKARGIFQAPALLIDGTVYSGALTFDALRPIVTERLAATNTAAYVPVMAAADLWERLNEGRSLAIVDVRSPEEFTSAHVRGARRLPVENSELNSGALERFAREFVGQLIVLVDDGSESQQRIAALLKALGHSVFRFEGMERASDFPALLVS